MKWLDRLRTTFGRQFAIDLGNRTVHRSPAPTDKRVRCRLHSGLLRAHLDFKVHWNNTMISYNLSWSRTPNEYDAAIYKALNFFHVPRSSLAEAAK